MENDTRPRTYGGFHRPRVNYRVFVVFDFHVDLYTGNSFKTLCCCLLLATGARRKEKRSRQRAIRFPSVFEFDTVKQTADERVTRTRIFVDGRKKNRRRLIKRSRANPAIGPNLLLDGVKTFYHFSARPEAIIFLGARFSYSY